jgi:calcineurin-like phosphoesterase family protein
MARFITADWHLGEDRLQIIGRPQASGEEMIEELVAKHNALVKPDDEVFVVGDVCYQKKPECVELVARFNGIKTLIRGNHDRDIPDEVFSRYFEQILPDGAGVQLDIEGIPCYITHYPTQGMATCFNLVGHIHTAWKYQLNMLNIGVDVHHFRPVNLDSIPFHLTAISEYYDEDVWVAYNEINQRYRGKRGKEGSYFK